MQFQSFKEAFKREKKKKRLAKRKFENNNDNKVRCKQVTHLLLYFFFFLFATSGICKLIVHAWEPTEYIRYHKVNNDK